MSTFDKSALTHTPHLIRERNKYAPWGRCVLQATHPFRAPYVMRKGNGKFDQPKVSP
jgi:hypothetical protein